MELTEEKDNKKDFLKFLDNIDYEKTEYIRLAINKKIEENGSICVNEFMKKCNVLNSFEKLTLIDTNVGNKMKNTLGVEVFNLFLLKEMNRNTFLLTNTLLNITIHSFETPLHSALKAIKRFRENELNITDENETIAFLTWRHFVELYEKEFDENPCTLIIPRKIEMSNNNTIKQIKKFSEQSIKL